ncbi:LacI family DNA-binding transcriptional regulator [Pseudaminobacter salicylatoxidans]|uniref:LacI family DNA-binding transcriptional regulator n=1 Tax=Pseudaminobacter salicylatoxidans TaxID=93369 RepID=UPI0003652AED|nr:LacI family DNA-binding transcriptional regulator [Pseudaminobacter salicylatoxidans]
MTIKDVAARAGVSIATVSNVFSGTKPVNQDLRERVEKAARELSYQLDRAASQLRSGQARVVGVLVPDLDDVFFTSLVSRIEVMAMKDGYDVIVASSRDDVELEQSRLRALLGWRPSGLIAVPCSDVAPALLRSEADRLPMVFADRVAPEGSFVDTVAIDNREAGEIAARHLMELGHREIVLAASSLEISPIRERVRGVSEMLHKTIGAAPVVLELTSNGERGAEIFSGWLERNERPCAVIGLTNVTTLSALSALARRQIDIPDPVSVIGFDDYPWMSARKTGLTAIRQPIEEMAGVIWERLSRRMSGDRSPACPTVLKTSLQVRDSVRAVIGRQGPEEPQRASSAEILKAAQ